MLFLIYKFSLCFFLFLFLIIYYFYGRFFFFKIIYINYIYDLIIFIFGFFFLFSSYEFLIFNNSFFFIFSFDNFEFFFFYDSMTILFLLLLELLIFIILIIFPFGNLNLLKQWKKQEDLQSNKFNFLLLTFFLYFIISGFFLTNDLLFFYIFFELSAVPLFFLINFFGKQKRRITAAYYLYYYTFVSSIGFLLSLLYIYQKYGIIQISLLELMSEDLFSEFILWFAILIPMLTKLPVIPFHLWLPEAHVEASTEGSVLLAGLLLKLGGYGLIRILIPIFPIASFYFNSLIFILGFISIFYASFSLFNQIDLKKMIAYLSIVHMNIFLLGLFSFNNVSLTGSIFLLLSHGLLSSVFFMIVGFFYEKFHSRNIYYFIGLNNKPRFVFIFFFIFLANISFPGTSSFVCELLIFIGLINKNMFLTFITIFATILSALFMALIYVKIAFGINNYFFFSFNIKYFQVYWFKRWDLNIKQSLILNLLIFINMILGIFPIFYTQLMNILMLSILNDYVQ